MTFTLVNFRWLFLAAVWVVDFISVRTSALLPMTHNPTILLPEDFPPLTSHGVHTSSPPSPQPSNPSLVTYAGAVRLYPKSPIAGLSSKEERKTFLAGHHHVQFGQLSSKNGRPMLIFSDEETDNLSKPFRFALIGKFSQGAPPYSRLHTCIGRL